MLELQQQTHKAEQDRRAVEARLNHLQSAKYKQTQSDIAEATAQLAKEQAHVKQLEDYETKKKEISRITADRIVREQMAAMPGGDAPAHRALETVLAAQKQFSNVMQERAVRQKHADSVLAQVSGDTDLFAQLNEYMTAHIPEFKGYENIEAMRSDIDYWVSDGGTEMLKHFEEEVMQQ